MLKGFYTLTSGMLTQGRRLNTISNNMTNVSTPGFKKDTLVVSTFQDELLHRTGNIEKRGRTPLASSSMITVPDESVTNYTQGSYQDTGQTFHAALTEPGFFEIRTAQGESRYTRNGSFTLDEEGYLTLQHVGRVMGAEGPIKVDTDKVTVDTEGRIIADETGDELGKIRVVDFADYKQLIKIDEGMFQNTNAQNVTIKNAAQIKPKTVERSNVNPSSEMVAMMSSQRALQSASQMLKIYDQIMAKAVSEIGKVV